MSVSTSEALKTTSIYKEQNGKITTVQYKIRNTSLKANEGLSAPCSEVQTVSLLNHILLYSENKNVHWVF